MARQQSLLERSLPDRMLDCWATLAAPLSVGQFVEEHILATGFLLPEEEQALKYTALCDVFRKRLRRDNPQTNLPIAAETPEVDEKGRPVWKQPELLEFDEAEWNLLQNLKRVKEDLNRVRRWYDWMMERWPERTKIKFPILVQAFEAGDSGTSMLELSRLTM